VCVEGTHTMCMCGVLLCFRVLHCKIEVFVHTKKQYGRILSESGTMSHESAHKKTGLLI
jgi:hypothetical protein